MTESQGRELLDKLVAALRELHELDEQRFKRAVQRPYGIGNTVIRARIERNRALLIELGEAL